MGSEYTFDYKTFIENSIKDLHAGELQIITLLDHLRRRTTVKPFPINSYVFLKYMNTHLLHENEGFILHMSSGKSTMSLEIDDSKMLDPKGFSFYKIYNNGMPPLVVSYKFPESKVLLFDDADEENFHSNTDEVQMSIPCSYDDVVQEHTIGLGFANSPDVKNLQKAITRKGIIIDIE